MKTRRKRINKIDKWYKEYLLNEEMTKIRGEIALLKMFAQNPVKYKKCWNAFLITLKEVK